MPQPKKAGRFGGTAAHHNMIMANLATELIRHGRINTTYAKAKNVQPLAEKMITFAKRGDLSARREVLRVIRDKDVVHKLFADVGPALSQRNGGYTRVLKLGPRKGDHAPMALIELVEGVGGDGEAGLDEAPKRRWSLRRRRGTQSVEARERAEERAAAVDRGEEPVDFDAEDVAEQTDSASPTRRELEEDDRGPAAAEDEERPQVDPAEVEARLAAQEADEAEGDDEPSAEEIAEQTDSASPSADDEDSKD